MFQSRVVAAAMFWTTVLFLPMSASAQANLSGLVQDGTGAILPGVTVEASSPALIEKVRSVVTDSAGRYSIVDLRPGTYAVVFILPGFSTVRQEGVVLAGSGVAQLNAVLTLGQLEETITVVGDSPLVDSQTTQQQFVVNQALLDTIPTPFRDFRSRLALVPGATTYKNGFSQGASHEMRIHGSVSDEARMLLDGMAVPGYLVGFGNFGGGNFFIEGAQQEVTVDTDSQPAESASSGVRMNAIPKEGGNEFSGQILAVGATGGMQKRMPSDTPVLIDGTEVGRIGESDRLKHTYDTNFVIGGPIKRGKLWFFGAYKNLEDVTYVANTYFQDGSQAVLPNTERAQIGRVTYQMTPVNKFRVGVVNNVGRGLYNQVGAGRTPEASRQARYTTRSVQVKWTAPVSNRLLLEAGVGRNSYEDRGIRQPGTENLLPHVELSTGISTGAYGSAPSVYDGHHTQGVASLSYVTGSHSFKAGVSWESGSYLQASELFADISALRFNNGLPHSITVTNNPRAALGKIDADAGFFVQDRWTVSRFTFNLGLRYDYFKASIPEQSVAAGTFVPARQTGAVDNVPNWKDVEPRLGLAIDLLGNGRTALKASGGRYVLLAPGAYTTPFNALASQSETRTWTDLDGNGSVVDANGNVQFDEIGPQVNARFGLPGSASRLDPDFSRPDNWQASISLQHELRPGLSVSAGYFGRWYGNFAITRNVLVDVQNDFTPFTIVAPIDSRLPDGGGYAITLYDLNADKRGQVDNVLTNSPENSRVYTGFDVSATMRLPNNAVIYGGITPERTSYDNCDVVNPNDLRFCSSRTPFQTLVKLGGSYSLPWQVELSGLFQGRPGVRLGALYTINNTIAGRSLTVVPAPVELIPHDTRFYDYFKQLDFRITKIFGGSPTTLRAYVDVFNVFNGLTIFGAPRGSQVTGANETYGPNWLLPQRSQQPRSLRIGAQFNF